MKKYIESIEDITGKLEDYERHFIQEEIIGTEKSAKDKVKLKEKENKKYKTRIHYCMHEERQPCNVKYIK